MTRRCTDQEAYDFIVKYLESRERLPWKTARYLSRQLRERRDCTLSPAELEHLLHDRMKEGKLRYSQYPGRQSLDLLWGHVDKVGMREGLWDTLLDAERLHEEVGELEPHDVAEDAPWVFLSHSFRDLEAVREIRDLLHRRGYGVWMAETHVLSGAPIVKMVQKGLSSADRFAMYATRHSLASRWVLKEGGVATRRWRLPMTLILDATDAKLLDMVRGWVEASWGRDELATVEDFVVDLPSDPADPTPLGPLLVSAFGEAESASRHAVLYPEDAAPAVTSPDARWWRTFDEVFPAV